MCGVLFPCVVGGHGGVAVLDEVSLPLVDEGDEAAPVCGGLGEFFAVPLEGFVGASGEVAEHGGPDDGGADVVEGEGIAEPCDEFGEVVGACDPAEEATLGEFVFGFAGLAEVCEERVVLEVEAGADEPEGDTRPEHHLKGTGVGHGGGYFGAGDVSEEGGGGGVEAADQGAGKEIHDAGVAVQKECFEAAFEEVQGTKGHTDQMPGGVGCAKGEVEDGVEEDRREVDDEHPNFGGKGELLGAYGELGVSHGEPAGGFDEEEQRGRAGKADDDPLYEGAGVGGDVRHLCCPVESGVGPVNVGVLWD